MSRAYCLTCNEPVMVTAGGTCPAGHRVDTGDLKGPEPWVGYATAEAGDGFETAVGRQRDDGRGHVSVDLADFEEPGSPEEDLADLLAQALSDRRGPEPVAEPEPRAEPERAGLGDVAAQWDELANLAAELGDEPDDDAPTFDLDAELAELTGDLMTGEDVGSAASLPDPEPETVTPPPPPPPADAAPNTVWDEVAEAPQEAPIVEPDAQPPTPGEALDPLNFTARGARVGEGTKPRRRWKR